jgi:hypothetical protein
VLFVYFAVVSLSLSQSVPQLINYQGRLTDGNGTPWTNGQYAVEVSLYTNAIYGDAVWGPQVFDGAMNAGHGARLHVVDGYFNVLLGPEDANAMPVIAAFINAHTWISVATNGMETGKRRQILSVPYAVRAASLPDAAVTQNMLAERQVGTNEVGLGGVAWSASSGTWTKSLSAYLYVDGLQVSLRTSGRPVRVELISAATNGTSTIGGEEGSGATAVCNIELERKLGRLSEGGEWVQVAAFEVLSRAEGNDSDDPLIRLPPSAFAHVDIPPEAGVYSFRVLADSGAEGHPSRSVMLQLVRLIAYEL